VKVNAASEDAVGIQTITEFWESCTKSVGTVRDPEQRERSAGRVKLEVHVFKGAAELRKPRRFSQSPVGFRFVPQALSNVWSPSCES
jgi:hypothetical protein